MTIRYVDLFCGIGGFRLAAELLSDNFGGLEPVASSDIDPLCKKFYQKAFGSEEPFIDDVNNIRTDASIPSNDQMLELPPFDLLLAGFPCQPFANIGPRSGLDDPRGTLIFKICDILKSYQPKLFVLENVQKLRNLGKGETLERIVCELELAGYHTHVLDLCASDFGVPQQRRRIFFCGIKKGAQRRSSLPTPERLSLKDSLFPTTWHLLERDVSADHIIPPKTRNTVLRRNAKWQGDIRIDRAISRPITATMAKWHRANQDNYFSERYIFGDEPNPNHSRDASSDDIVRRITPLEGFRLQGFPDRFEQLRLGMGCKYTATYRLIGNAVPVPLARAVISNLLNEHA